jgi:hypothetical protein
LPQGAYAGQKLTCNLNLLSPFINIVNFGLACIGVAGREPWFATDLTDGSISLYLLDSTDIKTVSELLNP